MNRITAKAIHTRPLTKAQLAEMYRLMPRIHRLKAACWEQLRYLELSRRHGTLRFDHLF